MPLNKKILTEDELAILDSPDVNGWAMIGIKHGATHMFVVDDQDANPGPVFAMASDDLGHVENRCWIAGHVRALYDLSIPLGQQV